MKLVTLENPNWLLHEMMRDCGIDNHAWIDYVENSVVSNLGKTGQRRIGKTRFISAYAMCKSLMNPDMFTVIITPNSRMIQDVMKHIEQFMLEQYITPAHHTRDSIYFNNDARIKVLANPILKGHTIDNLILEEIAMIDNDLINSILPCLARTHKVITTGIV